MEAETKREQVGTTIRTFLPGDVTAVMEILRSSPEAAQWTEWGFWELLGWGGVLALVSEGDKKMIGFIIGRQVGDEAEILNLAVMQAKRRKGEGGALLKAAMDQFRARQVSRVFLEVRESNESGICFYTNHGFAKTGRREDYYHDSGEGAILMEKKLTG